MMLVYRANYVYNMRVSIVADYIFQFNLEDLMNCPSPALPDTDSMVDDFMTSPVPQIVLNADFEGVNRRARDLDDMLCMFYGRDNKAIYATAVAISLHVDRETALASGLFGLQADAPVQTVDYNDLPRLRQFYELFKSDAALKEAEPHVKKRFDVILSPEFQAVVLVWQEKVKWLLQVGVWKVPKRGDDLQDFGGTDPRFMWTPAIPKNQLVIRMDQFVPNNDHSWWKEHAEKQMPTLIPQVMLRLCDNQCHKEERRPDMFGEVWFSNDEVHGLKQMGAGRVIRWIPNSAS